MTHVLLLAMWAIAISSWFTSLYFYKCASDGVHPDMSIVLKCVAASGLSLFIGCIIYSFLQASFLRYGGMFS